EKLLPTAEPRPAERPVPTPVEPATSPDVQANDSIASPEMAAEPPVQSGPEDPVKVQLAEPARVAAEGELAQASGSVAPAVIVGESSQPNDAAPPDTTAKPPVQTGPEDPAPVQRVETELAVAEG